MTEPKQPITRCDDCGHAVEAIQYTSEASGIGTAQSYRPAFKHKLPHKNCPCPRFNMGSDQVR